MPLFVYSAKMEGVQGRRQSQRFCKADLPKSTGTFSSHPVAELSEAMGMTPGEGAQNVEGRLRPSFSTTRVVWGGG